jgi:hypothetical protein
MRHVGDNEGWDILLFSLPRILANLMRGRAKMSCSMRTLVGDQNLGHSDSRHLPSPQE